MLQRTSSSGRNLSKRVKCMSFSACHRRIGKIVIVLDIRRIVVLTFMFVIHGCNETISLVSFLEWANRRTKFSLARQIAVTCEQTISQPTRERRRDMAAATRWHLKGKLWFVASLGIVLGRYVVEGWNCTSASGRGSLTDASKQAYIKCTERRYSTSRRQRPHADDAVVILMIFHI